MEQSIKSVAEHDIITIASEFFEAIGKCGSEILERNEQEYPSLRQELKMLQQISRQKRDESRVDFFTQNIDYSPVSAPYRKLMQTQENTETTDNLNTQELRKELTIMPEDQKYSGTKRIWRHAKDRTDPDKLGDAEVNRLKKRANVRFMPDVITMIKQESKKEGLTQEQWLLEAIELRLNTD